MTQVKAMATFANDLRHAAEALTDIVARENAALTDHRHDAIAALGLEKARATADYEKSIAAFVAAQAEGASLTPSEVSGLADIGRKLAALAAENERRLRAAVMARRRLLQGIANAVADAAPRACTYSGRGLLGTSRRVHAAPPAVSFNQAL